eukprot:4810759-Amphidinium_carterae.1
MKKILSQNEHGPNILQVVEAAARRVMMMAIEPNTNRNDSQKPGSGDQQRNSSTTPPNDARKPGQSAQPNSPADDAGWRVARSRKNKNTRPPASDPKDKPPPQLS